VTDLLRIPATAAIMVFDIYGIARYELQ